MLNPIQAIKTFWHHKFDFRDRASRSEYWWTALITFIFLMILVAIDSFVWLDGVTGDLPIEYEEYGWQGFLNEWNAYPLYNFFEWVLLIPLMFQSMRRLHDTGRRGWLAIIVAALATPLAYISQEPVSQLIFDLSATSNIPSFNPLSGSDYLILFYFFVLFILSIWQFVLNVLPSHKGPNRYGPNPLGHGNIDVFA